MATLKTQKNNRSVIDFLNSIEDEKKKEDCFKLLELFEKWTSYKGNMWGENIIGFGEYSYTNTTKKEYEWFVVGISARKSYISLYIIPYVKESEELLKKIGKAKVGKCCINLQKLEDIDLDIVKQLVDLSFKKTL